MSASEMSNLVQAIANYNAMIANKLKEIDAEQCSDSLLLINGELKKVWLFTFFLFSFSPFFFFVLVASKLAVY